MFHFKDNETLTITTRKHQYNAEALDGLITFIEDEHPALVIGHLPTKKFIYEYWVIEELPAYKALQKVEQLGPDILEGRPYYKAICKEDLDEYVEQHNLKERNASEKEKAQKLSETKKVKTSMRSLGPDIISVSEKKSNSSGGKASISSDQIISNSKLYRNTEKPIR